eukprot:gene37808-49531_t
MKTEVGKSLQETEEIIHEMEKTIQEDDIMDVDEVMGEDKEKVEVMGEDKEKVEVMGEDKEKGVVMGEDREEDEEMGKDKDKAIMNHRIGVTTTSQEGVDMEEPQLERMDISKFFQELYCFYLELQLQHLLLRI